jgi:hypothetical protein
MKTTKKYMRDVVDHGSLKNMAIRIMGDVGKKNKAFDAMKGLKKDMMGVRNANVLIGEN